jgi:hypothetical protein
LIATPFCAVLRAWLIGIVEARGARARRDDLKGRAYDYLTGPAFAQRLRGAVETAIRMGESLEAERRVCAAKFADREQQIHDVVCELAGLYGDVTGMGATPIAIEALELPAARLEESYASPTAT